MKYFINTEEGYIVALSTGAGETEVTEAEYRELLDMIRNKPSAEGKGYRLTTAKTWEEYDLIPVPIDEAPSAEERLAALEEELRAAKILLGVEV